jgi:hypothetical protein
VDRMDPPDLKRCRCEMGPARTSTPFFNTDVGILSIPSALVLFRPLMVLVILFEFEKLKENFGT